MAWRPEPRTKEEALAALRDARAGAFASAAMATYAIYLLKGAPADSPAFGILLWAGILGYALWSASFLTRRCFGLHRLRPTLPDELPERPDELPERPVVVGGCARCLEPLAGRTSHCLPDERSYCSDCLHGCGDEEVVRWIESRAHLPAEVRWVAPIGTSFHWGCAAMAALPTLLGLCLAALGPLSYGTALLTTVPFLVSGVIGIAILRREERGTRVCLEGDELFVLEANGTRATYDIHTEELPRFRGSNARMLRRVATVMREAHTGA